MRIAYLDCFSGISGDMFLGASVDAGVPFELLQATVASLGVGASLERSRVDRNGISATKIDVLVHGVKDLPREEFWGGQHHAASEREHRHPDTSHHGGARHLSAILTIIAGAAISETAKRTATAIFTALGEAEAKVHDVDIEKVHFHEVGAADAIVDIVCAAVCAEALAVDEFVVSPLNAGSGTVECAHGVLPVPAPATLELLQGLPIYSGAIQKELVTPTGAAIVKVLGNAFGPPPGLTTEKIGYGAGARDFKGHANVLRLIVGQTTSLPTRQSGADCEEIVILETNLDDLSPQVIAYTFDRLLAAGALEVFTTAVQMKKDRPAILMTVLARPQDEAELRGILFRETSTLGIRSRREQRHTLERRFEVVQTPWGHVRMKVGSANGVDVNAAPEYEDCRRIAAEQSVPLKTVMQETLRLYWNSKNG